MEDYFIKTDTIGLRCIKEEDREALLFWYNDSRIREKIGGIAPFNRNDFQEICHSYSEINPANIWFAVCEDDKIIGIAGLHNIKYVQRNAELAILIGEREEQRKGKGSMILKLVEDYAFGILNLHRLYAYVYGDNIQALHFFEKGSWQREGVLREASFWNYCFRDVEIWAKLKSKNGALGVR